MAIKKILVVDDTPLYLNQIRQILSDAGYEVISASSGTEALEQAKKELPDLIFMDIVMPEMDGFAACRAMTKNCETKDIPIAFVSSKDQEADRVWAELQGAKAYITKPYTADQILEQVEMFD
ncbi:MAG: response regulator [Methylococcaceae bacterium]|nr:response regulator [Methylococcaceae bacterium]